MGYMQFLCITVTDILSNALPAEFFLKNYQVRLLLPNYYREDFAPQWEDNFNNKPFNFSLIRATGHPEDLIAC